MREAEGFLQREGSGKPDMHPAHAFRDHRGAFQQAQPDRVHRRKSQNRALLGDATQPRQYQIGENFTDKLYQDHLSSPWQEPGLNDQPGRTAKAHGESALLRRRGW